MRLTPGSYYKVLQYGWSSPGGNPVYEEVLGIFVRVCPEIHDWYTSVLEFIKDGTVVHFRTRPIHKFIEYTNRYFMEKAEERMYERVGGRTLKEEITMVYRPLNLDFLPTNMGFGVAAV